MSPSPRHFIPLTTPPPVDLVRPGGWREQAACLNHPTLNASAWDDSLPAEGQRAGSPLRARRIAAAKSVCKTCPVRLPCLDDVNLTYDDGVRGGVDLRDLRNPPAPRPVRIPRDVELAANRERYREKTTCSCGRTVSVGNMPRHLRSVGHRRSGAA